MSRSKPLPHSKTPSPRTVFLAEGKTSVRLAPVMWGALEDIARHKGITRQDLLSEIYRERQGSGFTEAIRVYIVEFYRARVARGGERAVVRPSHNSVIADLVHMLYIQRQFTHLPQALTMISGREPGPVEGQVKNHRREAARLRFLAKSVTTGAVKTRLLEQALHHDWLASIEPEKVTTDEP